ncbi:TonB-dependent receptor [Flavisolibacter sp. BT320]|nr:TonB-dependent receptor [Flavisolibacter longurius]
MCTKKGFTLKAFRFLLLLLAFSSTVFAQNRVTGRIINQADNQPVIGATVQEKGTSNATQTGSDGSFTINAAGTSTLIITAIGYNAQEVLVNNRSTLSVTMQASAGGLDEVVVVGYGTQRRTRVTGAISSVNGKTLSELPVPSVSQALQGRVAGVQVTNNGSPGAQPIVRIRGISSISFASNPLYVVDGFPTGDLSAIDTRDIESVDVLKDASAAAIYGSRATSGVIIITTRKGRREGKIRVTLDSYVGTQTITKRLDLLNTAQYVQYATALTGGTLPPRLQAANFNQPVNSTTSQTYAQTNTDWQDEYFRSGMLTQHNVGLSGGNNISRFYASAGYFKQEGTSPAVGYERFNFRLNSDHQISKVFTFGQNLYVAHGDQAYDNNEEQARTNLVNVIRHMPYMPVYDPTTSSGYRSANNSFDGSDPTNPILDAEVRNPGNRKTLKVLGTAFLEVNFTSWLRFRSTFGVDHANTHDYRFSPIFESGGTVAGSSATVASIVNNRSVSTVRLFTEQLTFDKSFGRHHVNVIGVYEQQEQDFRTENISGQQPSNEIRTLLNASNIAASTRREGNYLMSILGRVNYDFAGKYLVSVAARRDGLSVWAPGRKWATFPSASVGWRIDQEEFMKSQSMISELKVRAGYGVTGLAGTVLGNFPWLVAVDANNTVYPFNNVNAGSTTTQGSSINALGNNELEWEKTNQLNIGLDLGLFRNKLTLSAEYFVRNTDNLLLNVPIPPSFGYPNASVLQNIAEMENKGFELQLGYTSSLSRDFRWNVLGNLSAIRNKVKDLAPGVPNIEAGGNQDFGTYNITRTEAGQAVQSFYGWIVDGIFQSQAEVNSSAAQVNPTAGQTYDPTKHTSPGDIKFRDINNDGVINEADRVFLGSFLPKFTYALNASASYKNFDLSVFFQGIQGNKVFNASRIISEGMVRLFNSSTEVLNAWAPGKTTTTVPRAINGDPNQNVRPSDRWIEDGSYLRLKNVMLAYNVPSAALSRIGRGVVNSFRIYVSSQNLLTFTKYKGFDPEVGNRTPGSSLTNGIDYATYPQPRSFQVGIQATF